MLPQNLTPERDYQKTLPNPLVLRRPRTPNLKKIIAPFRSSRKSLRTNWRGFDTSCGRHRFQESKIGVSLRSQRSHATRASRCVVSLCPLVIVSDQFPSLTVRPTTQHAISYRRRRLRPSSPSNAIRKTHVISMTLSWPTAPSAIRIYMPSSSSLLTSTSARPTSRRSCGTRWTSRMNGTQIVLVRRFP